jgi:hypothetical protein
MLIFPLSPRQDIVGNESATIICTKLAGQSTAVFNMTVPHTVSESTDSHDQARGPQTQALQSFNPPYGPVHRLKRGRIAPANEILQPYRIGECVNCVSL